MAFSALLVCAFGLGTVALIALGVPRERDVEFRALSMAAGLGLLGLLLGVLGLLGWFRSARWLIPAGALTSLVWWAACGRALPRLRLRWPSVGAVMLSAMVAAAGLGAVAPVTEENSLSYTLPIADRIAVEGRSRFWPDRAHSIYPLSQELLEAVLIDAGDERHGLLSAAELALAALLIVVLARRIAREAAAPAVAAIVALGCPSVAFLAASTKEDLLLLVMTVASALVLDLAPGLGSVAGAGVFAGLAAGSKYTGVPIAFAVVLCVPFCCGRGRRLGSLAVATLAAIAAGGLWYGVNIARFGNPLPPFMPSVGHFPVTPDIADAWLSGFGYGRAPLDAGGARVGEASMSKISVVRAGGQARS